MRFAHCANALQVAGGRWFEPSDFFGIKVKRNHAALQQVSGFWTFPGHRAQLAGRHANVPRHALDFELIAASKI